MSITKNNRTKKKKFKMTNSQLLRDKIDSSGLKKSYIAERISLTPYGFDKKIDNETEFKASEIQGLTSLLNLTQEESQDIFFAQKVI